MTAVASSSTAQGSDTKIHTQQPPEPNAYPVMQAGACGGGEFAYHLRTLL